MRSQMRCSTERTLGKPFPTNNKTLLDVECVHSRYIQACYIRKKTQEAKEKAKEDARRQILTAFFATEELRLEVQRRQQAAQRKEAMKMLNKSLEILETKLPLLMEKLQPVSEKLADVASSLDQVKHNLVVQVILIQTLLNTDSAIITFHFSRASTFLTEKMASCSWRRSPRSWKHF